MPPSPSDWKIFDAHVHFFSHGFFKGLMAQRPDGASLSDDDVTAAVNALGLEAPPRDPAELASRWIKEMDRHGVERVCLIASVPPDWTSVARAIELYPDRFAGYTMVHPLMDNAVELTRKALGEGGLRGICLFPAMHRFHVYDPQVLKVIAEAREHGAIVFCHFGILKIPIRDKLGVHGLFDGTYALPTDLHRVAAAYPDVTFQIPHFGAGYFRETLMLGAQCPNVMVDSSSSNSWMRLLGHPLTLVEMLRASLDVFGAERILWGSDSSILPRGWKRELFDDQLAAFREAGCGDEDLRKIFGGNLRRFLES